MRKIVQYSAYLVPIVFAAVCLAVFCRFFDPCPEKLQKADYAISGELVITPVYMVSDSER